MIIESEARPFYCPPPQKLGTNLPLTFSHILDLTELLQCPRVAY